ncbi:hypothetical protein DPMN_103322 [Dreissena polymorpha]|uniref:Uncharacterized protein n=1 Tax=Dreissena polymorpha TaxID=45954 RepID=A0A9D4H9K8_DREPO|nr:hypothetical protein DPMN_103322 [Dreissena polymorpha]
MNDPWLLLVGIVGPDPTPEVQEARSGSGHIFVGPCRVMKVDYHTRDTWFVLMKDDVYEYDVIRSITKKDPVKGPCLLRNSFVKAGINVCYTSWGQRITLVSAIVMLRVFIPQMYDKYTVVLKGNRKKL